MPPPQVSNFFLFYKNYFYLFVQAHHDTEEKLITPWFEGKGMHFPEKVSEDHHYLIAALNKIVSMEGVYRGIVREGGSERGPKLASWTADLKDQMKGLNNNMRKHLCEEESMYPTAMRDQVTGCAVWFAARAVACRVTDAGCWFGQTPEGCNARPAF